MTRIGLNNYWATVHATVTRGCSMIIHPNAHHHKLHPLCHQNHLDLPDFFLCTLKNTGRPGYETRFSLDGSMQTYTYTCIHTYTHTWLVEPFHDLHQIGHYRHTHTHTQLVNSFYNFHRMGQWRHTLMYIHTISGALSWFQLDGSELEDLSFSRHDWENLTINITAAQVSH